MAQKQGQGDPMAYATRVTYKTSAYTVENHIRVVKASTVSGTGAFTITLPAPGDFPEWTPLEIYMEARNATDNITISGQGISNITLAAADEYSVLVNDGVDKWFEISANHA